MSLSFKLINSKNLMKTFIRAISYAKHHIKDFLLSFIFSLIVALLATVPAYIVKHLIDDVLVSSSLNSEKMIALNFIIILFVSVIIIQSIGIYFRTYYKDLVRQKIVYSIRNIPILMSCQPHIGKISSSNLTGFAAEKE